MQGVWNHHQFGPDDPLVDKPVARDRRAGVVGTDRTDWKCLEYRPQQRLHIVGDDV